MRWLVLSWTLFFAAFAAGHLRVRRQRGPNPEPETRVRRDPRSGAGLALQAAGVLLSWVVAREYRAQLLPVSLVLAAAAIALAWSALLHLGRQWRIQAVITADHQLITTGPYGVLRHPLYLAFFLILAAWCLTLCAWAVSAVALVLFAAGTERRIQAEDGLLRAAFPREFPDYERRVRAWIPGIR
ncbi:MAG: isoprenylcysteine carboxylmethyltransferase family protein [Acidobacteria bacterium]|nr:isoprenylcysteine carboxylmethyltransferase family protein [Acidobacteriota bacterium]